MQSTQKMAARLATCRIPADRSLIGRGYRAPALMERLTQRTARLDILERFCAPAERKPTCIYDARKDEGRSLPDERMHALITQSIEEGWGTPESLADLFGDWFAMYRAMMPGAADATYVDTAREKVQAIEAMSLARTNPTPENCEHAVKELSEDAILTLSYTKVVQRSER